MTMTKVATKPKLVEVDDKELEAQLPIPVGYHLLVAMPEVEDTYGDTKILKSVTTIHHETIMSMVGLVLDMGAQAYGDKDRFSTGPWCAVGDYIMFRANTGTRFIVGGKEYRLMNDDSVEATVKDPRGVSRA
jgi:co-chaperonin GroES (HSP10)